MADGDRQAGLVGQLLEFPFPQPWPAAVAPAAVGLDQQMRLAAVLLLTETQPPLADRTHGELGRVRAGSHADVPRLRVTS